MVHRPLPSRSKLWMASVVGVILALSLSACGGSAAKPGEPAAEEPVLTLAAQVAIAKAPVNDWPGPTDPVTTQPGINLLILSCGETHLGCAIAAEEARNAAESLDWNASIVSGDSDLSAWDSAARQVAAGGYDAMIVMGATPELMSGDFARAVSSGVPIIGVFQPPFDGVPELDGYVTVDHAASGDILGKYIIEDFAGSAKVFSLVASDYPDTAARHSTLSSSIKKNCADCSASRSFIDPQKVSNVLAGQVASILRTANPSGDYIISPYSDIDGYVIEGIQMHEEYSAIKLISVGVSPEAITRIRNGEQHAMMVSSPSYMGWLAVDQMARVLAGQSTELVTTVPERIITADNVAEIDGDQGWQLEVDFRAKFTELWGR